MIEEKSASIAFQIKTIELLDSSLVAPAQPLSTNTVFQFDINLEHRLNIDNNLVIVVCSVSVLNENKDQLMGQLKSSCIYLVEKLRDHIGENSKSLRLPDDFIITLNSESISTTRGLMFSLFRGTFLHNAVLPIIDPKSFIKSGS
jgi:hypothetical protein